MWTSLTGIFSFFFGGTLALLLWGASSFLSHLCIHHRFCYLSGQKPLSIFGLFDKPWKGILKEEILKEEIDESGPRGTNPVEREPNAEELELEPRGDPNPNLLEEAFHGQEGDPLDPNPNPSVNWPLGENDRIMIKLLRKRLVDLGPLEGGRRHT